MDEKFLKLIRLLRSEEFIDKCLTCQFLYKHPQYGDMQQFLFTGFAHEIYAELKKRFGDPFFCQRFGESVGDSKLYWLPIQIIGSVSFNYVLQLNF